jgi:hypothetical protein
VPRRRTFSPRRNRARQLAQAVAHQVVPVGALPVSFMAFSSSIAACHLFSAIWVRTPLSLSVAARLGAVSAAGAPGRRSAGRSRSRVLRIPLSCLSPAARWMRRLSARSRPLAR